MREKKTNFYLRKTKLSDNNEKIFFNERGEKRIFIINFLSVASLSSEFNHVLYQFEALKAFAMKHFFSAVAQ